ncbi:hypothetical protein JCM3765_007198 [Sporobolomyces pararoseus]
MILQSLVPRITISSTTWTRCISTSSFLRNNSFQSQTYPGLYFHPHPDPPKGKEYSLSFLPTPAPSLSFSPTTIGQLRQPSTSTSTEPEILPRYFVENPLFLDLLHEVLKEEISKGDPWLINLAKSIQTSQGGGGVDTFIHLSDQRNPPEVQRTPQPQDIISSILVKGETGQLVLQSYERNKVAYRLVSELGLMKLPKSLMDKLVQACKRVRQVEEEIDREKKNNQQAQ